MHTEIGREANLTDGTCPEQCHISMKCGFWISLCIYILYSAHPWKIDCFYCFCASKQRWETEISHLIQCYYTVFTTHTIGTQYRQMYEYVICVPIYR